MSQPWERRTVDGDIGELYDRVKRLEANVVDVGTDGPWIYVGTVGVDGVDGLLTADSPPFENGWTNADPTSDEGPVAFLVTLNGWVHLRGGFTGGADGTVVFTLPTGYRPPINQPAISPTKGDPHFRWVANTDGTVLFVDQVA